MQRLKLTNEIVIEGKDCFGRKCELIFRPANSRTDNWYWGGGARNPITLQNLIVKPGLTTGHTLTLQHGRETHEAEHWLWPHFFGLRDVEVLVDEWPPFMCAAKLWEKLRDCVLPNGVLTPTPWPSSMVGRRIASDSQVGGVERWAALMPAADDLHVTAHTRYESLRQYGEYSFKLLRHAKEFPEEVIETLVRSRTMGQPRLLRRPLLVMSYLGWPHWDKLVWMPSPNDTADVHRDFCNELAAHQTFDSIGVISLAAREGEYISGNLALDKCNHHLSLLLAERIQARIRSLNVSLV